MVDCRVPTRVSSEDRRDGVQSERERPAPASGRDRTAARALVGWLVGAGERVGRVLVHSGAYLAVVAVVEVGIVTAVLSLGATLAPVVGGLVTFAVYANDRLADASTDAVSNPERAAFVKRHRDRLYVLASVAYSAGVALSVLGGPVALGVTLLPGVLWVLYASSYLPDLDPRMRGLKEVFLLNSGVVALAWAVSLTALPLAFADAPVTPATGVVFLYFLLRSFVDTEIPNVHDAAADRRAGVATLPVVLGVAGTRRALYAVDAATAVVLVYAALSDLLAPAVTLALGAGVAYSLAVVSRLGRAENGLLVVATELEYLVVAAALWVG